MSFNYLLNSTDKIKEKPFDIISRIDPKKIEQAFKNKKNIFKNTENNNKKSESFKYKKNLMILEKSYQDSLILLDILKKNREKNILEKYDIENIVSFAKNNDTIKKILMKKKFLIIPPYLSPKVN